MSALKNVAELTDRQRQIWERLEGIGEFEGRPQKPAQVAAELGVTTNNVYVTRRRVRSALGIEGMRTPKRIIRQESNLDSAVHSLQSQLDGYEEETRHLQERLEQIERERPAIESALERLRDVTETGDVAESVAA